MQLTFIAAVVFIIVASVCVIFALVRALKNNNVWKVAELHFIREVKKSADQKIVAKIMLNANYTADFTKGEGFWLWLAFTPDYIAFVLRDELAESGSGHLLISKKKEVSMTRLEKNYAELELKNPETQQSLKIIVFVRSADYELLNRYIR